VAVLTVLGAGALNWQSAALMAGLLAFWAAMNLLVEWQARRTLIALVRTGRAGPATIHREVPGGQVVHLVLSAEPDQCRQQPRT
jgi:hypothetical protein